MSKSCGDLGEGVERKKKENFGDLGELRYANPKVICRNVLYLFFFYNLAARIFFFFGRRWILQCFTYYVVLKRKIIVVWRI